jgi:HTH-type transcriptional regulator, glycine betaine synthesis regulator
MPHGSSAQPGAALIFQNILKDPSASPTDPLSAELAVADTVGRLMHFWGFKRPMGRLWTLLYLSKRPLTAAELGETLQMSSGAVSMALGELEKWGAIARSWVPGERRDYFLAEPSVWKMVARVIRERELGIVRDFQGTLNGAIRSLDQKVAEAPTDPGDTDPAHTDDAHKLERLRQLASLAEAGESLLSALVSGSAVDPQLLNDTSSKDLHDPRH